eukprot:SAG22_NODE_78_length_22065_cov_7.473095_1_plen_65_part_00
MNWPYARGLTSSIFVATGGEAELGCGWCTGQALGRTSLRRGAEMGVAVADVSSVFVAIVIGKLY